MNQSIHNTSDSFSFQQQTINREQMKNVQEKDVLIENSQLNKKTQNNQSNNSETQSNLIGQLQEDQFRKNKLKQLQLSANNIRPNFQQNRVDERNQSIQSFTVSKVPSCLQYNSALKMDQSMQFQYEETILTQSFLREMNSLSRIQNQLNQNSITQLQQQYQNVLKLLRKTITKESLIKAQHSNRSMRTDPNLFIQEKLTSLFWMDFLSSKGRSRTIGDKLLKEIRSVDKYLLQKIQIGAFIQPAKLSQLFQIEFESLQELVIERYWGKYIYPEHGIEFIKNVNNLKRLRNIVFTGDFLSPKLIESFKQARLSTLQVIELRFTEQVKDNEIISIFQNIDEENHQFNLHILTSKKQKDQFNSSQLYNERIVLIHRSQQFGQYVCEKHKGQLISQTARRNQEIHHQQELLQQKQQQSNKQPELPCMKNHNQITQIKIDNKGKVGGDVIIGQKGDRIVNNF